MATTAATLLVALLGLAAPPDGAACSAVDEATCALEDALPAQGLPDGAPAGDTPAPLSPADEAHLDAARQVAAAAEATLADTPLHPDRDRLRAAAARARLAIGERLHWRGHLRAAVDALSEAVDRYPDTDAGADAIAEVFDLFRSLRREPQLLAWLQERRPRGRLGPPKRAAAIMAAAWFEAGQTHFEDHDDGAAMEAFGHAVVEAERTGRSELAGRAAFNQAIALQRAERWPGARAAYDRIVERWPRSSLAEHAQFSAAHIAERLTDLGDTAERFAAFAARYPDSQHAADALVDAATMFELGGDAARAAALFERFAARYPKARTAPWAALRAAELQAHLGDRAGQRATAKTYEAIAKRYRQLPAVRARAQLAAARAWLTASPKAHRRRAKRLAEAVGPNDTGSADVPAGLGGAAALLLADLARDAALPFRVSWRRFGAGLERAMALRKRLGDGYREVARHRDAHATLGALCGQAELELALADALSEVAPQLGASERATAELNRDGALERARVSLEVMVRQAASLPGGDTRTSACAQLAHDRFPARWPLPPTTPTLRVSPRIPVAFILRPRPRAPKAITDP